MVCLVVLTVGIFSVAWWSLLPSLEASLVVLVCCIPLWTVGKLKLPLFFLLGVFWGICCAHLLLKHSLPEEFDGEDILLSGTIVGLVDSNSKRSRFSFRVDSAQLLTDTRQPIGLKKVLLSWYGAQQLQPGQHWQLVARLRRPRGFVNPQTFDYQSWLYQQGYGATGYVRDSQRSRQLQNSSFAIVDLLVGMPALWRTALRDKIVRADLSERGTAVILALTLGDKRRLSEWWQDLARLGIVHLLVISGLHIGLIALLGAVVGRGLTRAIIILSQLFFYLGIATRASPNIPWLAPITGLSAAFVYSLLAGFSLPTQRALIAVVVVVFARLSFRKIAPLSCMIWALLLIAISQPLAVLSAGFWLSFSAVGLLIWWFTPWRSTDRHFAKRRTLSAQLALLAGMSVPLLLFLGKVSWLAPAVNLFAVPWVSFITVPLSLLGSFMPSDSLAEMFWQWADWSVSLLWWLLNLIPAQLGFMVLPMAISLPILCAVLLAGFAVLLPRGVTVKWLGLLPLVLLLLSQVPALEISSKREIALRLTVLDVGQGLAVTVETKNHTLVYDSGIEYSKQFSTGSGIIAPYLWQRGRNQIHTTIISHEDGDHSGGLPALQKVLPSHQLLVGPAVSYSPSVTQDSRVTICAAGQRWIWDDIVFQVLAPIGDSLERINSPEPIKGNNSSCVIKIQFKGSNSQHINVLLPGDIERSAELSLLKSTDLSRQPIDLLIAPHHGSKTSSTRELVQRLAPKHVVFSAGYRHQFGHPHNSVEKRYRQVGSQLWNTGEQGAITFSWLSTGELQVSAARDKQKRWWR
jgi:competence protein ComEC